MKNYGFSDAADLFVFISGYTVALVYSRTMAAKGFLVAAVGILALAWQIYVAHILLFVFYVVAIAYIAERYNHVHLLDEFNVRLLIAQPIEFLKHGLEVFIGAARRSFVWNGRRFVAASRPSREPL